MFGKSSSLMHSFQCVFIKTENQGCEIWVPLINHCVVSRGSGVLSARVLQQHGGTLQKWRDDAGTALLPVRSCLLLCQWAGRDRDGPVPWCKSAVVLLASWVVLVVLSAQSKTCSSKLVPVVYSITSATLLRECMPSASCSSCAHSWPLISHMRKPIPEMPWGRLCARVWDRL